MQGECWINGASYGGKEHDFVTWTLFIGNIFAI